MKKRIMAFILMMVMTISMISCGNNKSSESKASTADVTGLFNKAEGMEAKTAEFSVDIDMAGRETDTKEENALKLGFKVSAFTQQENKSQADISYKLNDAKEYKALTTIVSDQTDAYLDMTSLKAAALDICNTLKLSQQAAMISVVPDAGYLKVGSDMLKKYTGSMELGDAKTAEKVIRTVAEYVMKTVQEATKEVSPACITGSDGELTFALTKENLVPAVEAILSLDLNAKYDEMVAKVKKLGNTEDYVTALNENKSSVIADMQDALNEVKNEKDDFDAFSVQGTIGITGDAGNRKVTESISVNIEQKSEKVKLGVNLTFGEAQGSESEITIPSESTDVAEYMKKLSGLLGY